VAVTIDAVSTPTPGYLSWNHTIGAGNNRLLVVCISSHSTHAPVTVQYGSASLTLFGSSAGNYRKAHLFYLVDPPEGEDTITIDDGFDDNPACGAISFLGADQVTPLENGVAATGSASPATVDVSSASGSLVIGVVAAWSWNTLTVGAGQTERWNYANPTYGPAGAGSTEPGDTTITMSWTLDSTSDYNWAMYGVSVKDAPALPPVGLSVTIRGYPRIALSCPPIGPFVAGGIDEYTVLMLHCDGEIGSKVLSDSSPYDHPVNNPYATIQAAEAKFGQSLYWADDYDERLGATPLSDEFYFEDGDFTVDFWHYPTEWNAFGVFGMDLFVLPSAGILFPYSNDGINLSLFISSTGSFPWDIANGVSLDTTIADCLNTWTHWALVRHGNQIKAYRNGVCVATVTTTAAIYHYWATAVTIHASQNNWIGHIDELRISKGIARWTEDFTPPTEPYSGTPAGGVSLSATASAAMVVACPAISLAALPSIGGLLGGAARYRFNGVIDYGDDLWGIVNRIAAIGRGILVASGGKYRVVVDRAVDAPVQVFTEGNSRNVAVRPIPRSERANVLVTTYIDADYGYQERTVSEEDVQSGEYPIVKTIPTLIGCTSETWARAYLRHLLLQNRYVGEMVDLEAGVDSIEVEVGDVFALQTRAADLALGGRIVEVSGGNVVIDEPFTPEIGVTYILRIWGQDGEQYTWTGAFGSMIPPPLTEIPAPTGYTQADRYGAPFILVKETLGEKWYRCTGIRRSGQTLFAVVSGIEYRSEVYAND
jgi:hypothetical protein